MRRRLVIPALLTLAVLLGAGIAQGELSQNGNLRISFNGGFSPHSLPRDRPAPVTVDIEGAIGTTDGSHPPAVRRIEFALNRNGRLSTAGLPACSSGAAAVDHAREAALARCRPALVGRGSFGADVEFASVTPFPADGTMLAFNGERERQAGPAAPSLRERCRCGRPSSCR